MTLTVSSGHHERSRDYYTCTADNFGFLQAKEAASAKMKESWRRRVISWMARPSPKRCGSNGNTQLHRIDAPKLISHPSILTSNISSITINFPIHPPTINPSHTLSTFRHNNTPSMETTTPVFVSFYKSKTLHQINIGRNEFCSSWRESKSRRCRVVHNKNSRPANGPACMESRSSVVIK